MSDFERLRLMVVASIGGLAAGIGFVCIAWYVVVGTGQLFEHIHPAVRYVEFGASIGDDVYFLCLSLGAGVGAFALLRRKMPLAWRVFYICAALPLLGFFALCSFFSINDLTSTPHL